MDQVNFQIMARFPFLHEASDYVKDLKLSIDILLKNIAYRSAWERAKERLSETLDFNEIQEHGITSKADYINELLSYVIARIMVSCIDDPYMVRRYALAEAVYAYKELQRKSSKFIVDVAKQFDLKPIEIKENEIDLIIMDYLKYSISLRDPELKWKLINRDVSKGQVTVTNKDLARLTQEALRFKIQSDLPIKVDPELKKMVNPRIKEIITSVQSKKRKFETKDLGKVSITRFPPCMKQLLGMTQAGENVSHVGRFALATFLFRVGIITPKVTCDISSSYWVIQ